MLPAASATPTDADRASTSTLATSSVGAADDGAVGALLVLSAGASRKEASRAQPSAALSSGDGARTTCEEGKSAETSVWKRGMLEPPPARRMVAGEPTLRDSIKEVIDWWTPLK